MKIQIMDYEIEIKAKSVIMGDKKYNEKETLYFLNWLTTALHSGANYQDSITCHTIAKDMRNAARELFAICEEKGLYNSNTKKK